MTSLQVQYFLKVAESMSFSKAAEELYVSQPSVSRQVQLLEQELGFSLFDRSSKRNLTMTPAGVVFREYFLLTARGMEEAKKNRCGPVRQRAFKTAGGHRRGLGTLAAS